MKLIAPGYYPDFRCIADRCRHSCCVGWEIDVDEDALHRYAQLSGPLGDRLRAAIDQSGDTPHFRLDAQERCPFLNEKGLCDLICQLGEDSLCQICADHPRFRSYFADRTEIGLGLCCEEAARLILSQQEKTTLITLEDDGAAGPLPEEEALVLQQREALMAIAQDRRIPIGERVSHLSALCGAEGLAQDLPQWADFLLTLERLDERWAEELQLLRDAPAPAADFSAEEAIHFEQLLVYFLYRHIPGAVDDGDLQGRLAFSLLSWQVVARLFVLHQDRTLTALTEIARLYSSEIEYSDDNLSALLDALDEYTMQGKGT